MEVAQRWLKTRLKSKRFYNGGCWSVFITPCAAKVTSVKAPYEKDKSSVDGVISMKDIYLKLLDAMKKVKILKPLNKPGWEVYAGPVQAERVLL